MDKEHEQLRTLCEIQKASIEKLTKTVSSMQSTNKSLLSTISKKDKKILDLKEKLSIKEKMFNDCYEQLEDMKNKGFIERLFNL